MNNWSINRSIRKRCIVWLLFLLNALCIFMYIFKCILCPNKSQKCLKLLVLIVQVLFYYGYKFGVNDLKATEGVTIFHL